MATRISRSRTLRRGGRECAPRRPIGAQDAGSRKRRKSVISKSLRGTTERVQTTPRSYGAARSRFRCFRDDKLAVVQFGDLALIGRYDGRAVLLDNPLHQLAELGRDPVDLFPVAC